LVQPDVVDKDKWKSIVIDNPRVLDENKILSREVVVEKTPDGGETSNITITI
jgi:hypothetical protein